MCQLLFQIVNAHAALKELLIDHHFSVQRNVGRDAFNNGFGKCRAHSGDSLVTGVTVSDELADHGVVMRRNEVTGVDVRVDTNTGAAGLMQCCDAAGAGDEAIRIFSVDTALNRVTLDLNVALTITKFFRLRQCESVPEPDQHR